MTITLVLAAFLAASPATVSSAAPDTMSLAWLEQQVLARNPGYAAMRAAAAQAGAQSRVTGALEDPNVVLMGAPASFGSGPPDAGYRVQITQRLAPFGQRGLQKRAAGADAGAAGEDAEGARLDLLRQTREAFFDYYLLARSVENTDEQSELMNQFRRVALAKYSAGTGEQQDPLSADLELAELEHRSIRLETEQRELRARLNTLLHLPVSAPLPPAPRELPAPAAADTSSDSIATRGGWPGVAAADARVAAAESRVSLAGRERLPRFEIGWYYDRAMDVPEWRSMGMVGFNVPIGLGRLGAAEDESRAGLARAQAERASAADEAARHVADSSAELEEAEHEVEVIERSMVPTSQRALTAARASYESGRGTFLALLDVARRSAGTRLELEMARVRRARAWAEVQHATAADRLPPGEEARP
jgi:outer membrane protein TolC